MIYYAFCIMLPWTGYGLLQDKLPCGKSITLAPYCTIITCNVLLFCYYYSSIMYTGTTVPRTYQNLPILVLKYIHVHYHKYTPKALRAAPAGAKKPARAGRAAPEALR